MARKLTRGSRVVLLGSVASGKYVDVLLPILGDRLRYPTAFVGRGDMSRGGLMLRSAASGEELEYGPLTAGVRPRGPRPPKLDPSTRVAVSLEYEATRGHGGRPRGVVELALSPGTAGAERFDAVVDLRLRARRVFTVDRNPDHELSEPADDRVRQQDPSSGPEEAARRDQGPTRNR